MVIDEELTEFYKFRKHFLIMSDAGKPIYTRYGDEEMLSPFFATVSAILHKIQSYYVLHAEREQSNQLKWVTSRQFDCAVLRKGNLIYICLVNNRVKLSSGEQFSDEKFAQQQIERIHGKHSSKLSSNKSNFSTSTAMHPS